MSGPKCLGGKPASFDNNGNPNDRSFQLRDVVLPSEISEGRAESRRELRTALDRLKRYTDKLADDPAVSFDQYCQQGIDLVLSPQAQAAFDIHREDEKVRAAYGRNDFGQRMLLAPRPAE